MYLQTKYNMFFFQYVLPILNRKHCLGQFTAIIDQKTVQRVMVFYERKTVTTKPIYDLTILINLIWLKHNFFHLTFSFLILRSQTSSEIAYQVIFGYCKLLFGTWQTELQILKG